MPIEYEGEPVELGETDIVMDLEKPCTYFRFQKKFRKIIATRTSHNKPVVWKHSKGIVVVGLKVGTKMVLFAIRQSDCYLIAFRTIRNEWWELVTTIEKGKRTKYFIQGAGDLKLGVNYAELLHRAGLELDGCIFNKSIMQNAIRHLASFEGTEAELSSDDCAAIFRCTVFICEGARFLTVEQVMHRGITNPNRSCKLLDVQEMLKEDMKFNSQEVDLIHNWQKMSKLFIKADDTYSPEMGPPKFLKVLGLILQG